MSEIKDDPREVLVLLNSLGFVGITATQLKAFMKDLKIYRKIKERERQHRKEEIKTKLISKQQALIKGAHVHENIIHSEPINFFNNESLVKVRIRCIPTEEDIQDNKCPNAATLKLDEKLSTKKYMEDAQVTESNRLYCEQSHIKSYTIKKCSESENKPNVPKHLMKNNNLVEECKYSKVGEQTKPVTSKHEHSVDKVTLSNDTKLQSKNVALEQIENVHTQGILSARSSINSRHKSFIRPWRLQSETQRSNINKKCDPVALYQKYQQEWKKISFPGEAKHSRIRWAVRERMLGTDPCPVPLSKKSSSMPILRKKC